VTSFVLAYLAAGIAAGAAVIGWAAVTSVRRHGFRSAVRGAARASTDDPPLVGAFAWLCVLAYPVLFVIAVATDGFDAVGAAAVFVLWLGAIGLLRWHLRARSRRRAREPEAG
jgi:hypothetical protein